MMIKNNLTKIGKRMKRKLFLKTLRWKRKQLLQLMELLMQPIKQIGMHKKLKMRQLLQNFPLSKLKFQLITMKQKLKPPKRLPMNQNKVLMIKSN